MSEGVCHVCVYGVVSMLESLLGYDMMKVVC